MEKNRILNKVDFFCIGAQKAGTTLLHDILKQHKNIYLPDEKEAHFFDVNELYEKGLDYYFKTYFKTYKGEDIIGNINPNLQVEERSINRIIECFGNIKIIILLRNPVHRAYSHYLMSRKRGYEELSFIEAIEKEDDRISNPVIHRGYESLELGHFEKNHYGYVSRGLYSELLKNVYEKLPKENIRVYIFEDFIKNKAQTIEEILSFLKLNYQDLNLELKSNPAQQAISYKVSRFLNTPSKTKDILKYAFPESIRKPIKQYVYNKNLKNKNYNESFDYKNIMNEFFQKDIEKVEDLLGKEIMHWK